jgi:hypothetical protein
MICLSGGSFGLGMFVPLNKIVLVGAELKSCGVVKLYPLTGSVLGI